MVIINVLYPLYYSLPSRLKKNTQQKKSKKLWNSTQPFEVFFKYFSLVLCCNQKQIYIFTLKTLSSNALFFAIDLAMKVTVCFDDIKVIVPCGSSMPQSNSFLHGYNFKMIDATTSENESSSMSTSSTCSSINSFAKMDKDTSQVTCNQVKVSSVIESSIARFKKATGKVR